MSSHTIKRITTRVFLITTFGGCVVAVYLLFPLAGSPSAASDTPVASFTNSTAITVTSGAANNGVPYPSSISVSGMPSVLPSTPGAISVTLNGFTHTFPDDIGVVLVAPNGDALLLQNGCGDDPDMVNVTYTLSDAGAVQLPALTAWTAGVYKPTGHYTGDAFPAPGPGTTYGHPGPAGSGTATFASVFGGDNPNGTWNLFVRDFVTGDAGNFAGGWTLTIAGTVMTQHVVDMNGDGRTDFSVVRNTGGGPSGQITWFTNYNGTGSFQINPFGIATDFFVPEDYDGDGKTDIAVWRTGATAFFYILRSATNTFVFTQWGITGDDPKVVGDYDGDNKADVAVYRPGASAGQQSFWYYVRSSDGGFGQIQWGQNGDFPAPGDYDGDGRQDCAVQRNAGGGSAIFYIRFFNGSFVARVFGTPTDVIVPGDYDGDGATDIATVRSISGQINWFYDPSSIAGTQVVQTVFGASSTDFPTQGDYDGDGRTDPAVWRPSATPGQTAFYFTRSTGGFGAQQWGQNGDYPVANYNTH